MTLGDSIFIRLVLRSGDTSFPISNIFQPEKWKILGISTKSLSIHKLIYTHIVFATDHMDYIANYYIAISSFNMI